MKLTTILSFSFFAAGCLFLSAQNKKVGIHTETPTEMMDVKETMRVRILPNQGSTYIDGLGSSQTFNATNPVVNSADGFNVIGKNSKSELVNNNSVGGFTTLNNSTAMFVIKRYAIPDWPSQSGNVGMPTGMDAGKWEAVMSNVSFTFTAIQEIRNVFNENHLHSWTVFVNGASSSFPGGEWRIIGDINGVDEKSDFVDVLFIKKGVVAADSRSSKFNF